MRIGFLSGVRHAQPYATLLADDPRVQLVGVAEESSAPTWMHEDTAALGLPVLDVDSLLDPAVVDAVVVCSEPTRHAALASRALKAGLHVLVDKPVGTSLAEVDELVGVASGARGTASVINRLPSPALQRLRGWVDAGHLGLPLHVDAEWFAAGAHFATSVERPELVVDPALSGGGEVLNFLLYPVDQILHLTGLAVQEVHCEAATLFGGLHEQHGVEDTAVVSLLLEHGVTATVTVGRVPAAPGLGPVSSTLRLLGSHGHATADDDRPAVSRFTTAGGVEAIPVGGDSSAAILRLMLDDYVTRLVAGQRPSYSLEQARASLAVVDAAYRSIASGQPARLT